MLALLLKHTQPSVYAASTLMMSWRAWTMYLIKNLRPPSLVTASWFWTWGLNPRQRQSARNVCSTLRTIYAGVLAFPKRRTKGITPFALAISSLLFLTPKASTPNASEPMKCKLSGKFSERNSMSKLMPISAAIDRLWAFFAPAIAHRAPAVLVLRSAALDRLSNLINTMTQPCSVTILWLPSLPSARAWIPSTAANWHSLDFTRISSIKGCTPFSATKAFWLLVCSETRALTVLATADNTCLFLIAVSRLTKDFQMSLLLPTEVCISAFELDKTLKVLKADSTTSSSSLNWSNLTKESIPPLLIMASLFSSQYASASRSLVAGRYKSLGVSFSCRIIGGTDLQIVNCSLPAGCLTTLSSTDNANTFDSSLDKAFFNNPTIAWTPPAFRKDSKYKSAFSSVVSSTRALAQEVSNSLWDSPLIKLFQTWRSGLFRFKRYSRTLMWFFDAASSTAPNRWRSLAFRLACNSSTRSCTVSTCPFIQANRSGVSCCPSCVSSSSWSSRDFIKRLTLL